MNEFSNNFWPWFIFIPTFLGILGLLWLIRWMSSGPGSPKSDQDTTETETTGHSWDGLQELNNPLPRWWLNLFYITIVFGVGYLFLYPGSGIYQGYLNWTSKSRYEAEMKQVNARLKPQYDAFLKRSIPDLAGDHKAMRTGVRIFYNNCMTCHGSDAGGIRGFPSLKDNDWLYGGTPEKIKESISKGRNGVMPAWGPALPGDNLANVTEYVLSLSNRKHDSDMALKGKIKFQQLCIGCHGPEAKGMQVLGAPNLTDNIWLHGAARSTIMDVIKNGRSGQMPAHETLLSEAKIHLLAAYIYSLSQNVNHKNNKDTITK